MARATLAVGAILMMSLAAACGGAGADTTEDCQSEECVNANDYCDAKFLTCHTAGAPVCKDGVPTCGDGFNFQASLGVSGCIPNGTVVGGVFTPSFDNPMGTCASVGDVVIQCNPGCSFCMKPDAKIPNGCKLLM